MAGVFIDGFTDCPARNGFFYSEWFTVDNRVGYGIAIKNRVIVDQAELFSYCDLARHAKGKPGLFRPELACIDHQGIAFPVPD